MKNSVFYGVIYTLYPNTFCSKTYLCAPHNTSCRHIVTSQYVFRAVISKRYCDVTGCLFGNMCETCLKCRKHYYVVEHFQCLTSHGRSLLGSAPHCHLVEYVERTVVAMGPSMMLLTLGHTTWNQFLKLSMNCMFYNIVANKVEWFFLLENPFSGIEHRC